MTSEPTADSEHDLLEAYALDAVDDVQRRRFERHLDDCSRCQVDLDRLREAIAQWSLQVATPPAPALRRQILDAAAVSHPEAGRAGSRVSRRTLLGAAAAVALGGGAVTLWRFRRPDAPDPVTADGVLRDPRAQTWHTTYRGSRVTLARNDAGRAAARFDPAPPAATGLRYTAWAASADGALRNAGQIPASTDAAVVLLDGDLRDADAVAFTLERGGTHPARPTSPALFRVALTA